MLYRYTIDVEVATPNIVLFLDILASVALADAGDTRVSIKKLTALHNVALPLAAVMNIERSCEYYTPAMVPTSAVCLFKHHPLTLPNWRTTRVTKRLNLPYNLIFLLDLYLLYIKTLS